MAAAAAACTAEPTPSDPTGGPITAAATLGGSDSTAAEPTSAADDDPDADAPDDDDASDGPETKFDIGTMGSAFCENKEAGIFCDGRTSVLCDGNGNAEDSTVCTPELCLAGTGCVACLEGQYACHGPRVMSCNTAGPDPLWQEIEVCDPANNEACDVSLGTCNSLSPVGGTEPSGVYYQFAVLDLSPFGYSQISDVDSYQNRIYFVAYSAMNPLVIGVYDVSLLDTDGDGLLEPNQHPDNPDEQGVIEERVFTFVEDFPINNPGAYPNVMELYATANKLFYTGPTAGLMEYDLASGVAVQVAPPPAWMPQQAFQSLSFLGYDDINEVWYSGNEMARRVIQYDATSSSWGWSFEYPLLAGDHMDGIEVVTDVSTGIPYVYVSDMTSNFIGQYRLDPNLGWVQENLFSYVESAGAAVEGFGFGALNHFWVGSLANTLYELGGGDLTDFLDPEG